MMKVEERNIGSHCLIYLEGDPDDTLVEILHLFAFILFFNFLKLSGEFQSQ